MHINLYSLFFTADLGANFLKSRGVFSDEQAQYYTNLANSICDLSDEDYIKISSLLTKMLQSSKEHH